MNRQKMFRGGAPFLLFLICVALNSYGQESSIKKTIPVPGGYVREVYPDTSYSHWLQNMPLKGTRAILDYRGQRVESDVYRVWEVVQLPLLFRSDLEQCADFAMRLWAEYHRATGKLNRLYLFDYNGRKMPFAQSGKSFNQFMRWAFANTNSHSLKNGCRTVVPDQIVPGDMFIQNERGGIGHVSVVLDVCSGQGNKLLLVGYSFMPAQEFHIEKADAKYGVKGWFTYDGYIRYLFDNLNYGKPVLRRFDPQ